MSFIEIFILSAIQGLSEFLPISSSGHLILVQKFVDIQEGSMAFDVSLHLGTLLSVIIYFHKDFMILIKDSTQFVLGKNKNPALMWQVIIATIPAVIMGVLLTVLKLEDVLRAIPIIAVNSIIFGIILYYADKNGKKIDSLYFISKNKALLIGIAQSLALIPGVSRSGITISASRMLGVDKISAVKFSMLISIPAILGAALLTTLDTVKANEKILNTDFLVGIILSFIVGIIVINFLMKFLQKFSFKVFMIYRIILGVFLLMYYFFLV